MTEYKVTPVPGLKWKIESKDRFSWIPVKGLDLFDSSKGAETALDNLLAQIKKEEEHLKQEAVFFKR